MDPFGFTGATIEARGSASAAIEVHDPIAGWFVACFTYFGMNDRA
jgi:hypothetical protein